MPKQIDLTVTIVSWNTRELLRACLESVAGDAARCGVEIHVVDNGSGDGSAEMVRSEFPSARLIAVGENLGFARANNLSWREARGRYWMLLNSDAEVRPGALDALVDFMDSRPRAGLATARLVSPDGTPQHCAQPCPSILLTLLEAARLHKLLTANRRGRIFLGPYWNYDEPVRVGWTWGTALIARREAVEEAGPLSEEFFMYGEDLEWCLRISAAGWEVWYRPEAEALHHGGQSSAQKWNSEGQLRIKLDGVYKAIERHRGRAYVRALQAATLTALGVEWLASRLRHRTVFSLNESLDYHLDALKRPGLERPA